MGKLQKWSFMFYEIAKMESRQKVAQKRHQRSTFSQNRHREAFSVSFPVKCHVHEGSIVISRFPPKPILDLPNKHINPLIQTLSCPKSIAFFALKFLITISEPEKSEEDGSKYMV
jgi:hypothetical protein